MQKLAILGLGAMGHPIARNLAAKRPSDSETVVAVDSDPARLAGLDGPGLVATADRTAVDGAAVLFLCLPNGDVVEAALFGGDRLAERLAPGAIVVDLSTIAHAKALAIGRAVAAPLLAGIPGLHLVAIGVRDPAAVPPPAPGVAVVASDALAGYADIVVECAPAAALPGIVGAVLLAASRAIGETMIVVLGAGASAQMSLNPFEAMTTITVKIVSQLTGDTDFAAPETLVAFALGITLFIVTLGLNIVALYIVRKYREQYE